MPEDPAQGLPALPERVARTHAIAGSFDVHWTAGFCEDASRDERGYDLCTAEQMRSYALAAVEAERERCAALIDAASFRPISREADSLAFEIAAAIRNQGKP